MATTKIDKHEIAEFLKKCGPDTKVYLGCDSERYKSKGQWFADYTLAVVVHIDGRCGAKIFAEVQSEADYDQKAGKPFTRMMNETYKVAQLYQDLKEVLHDFEVMIHLDINPSADHGSNVAYAAAVGYIKGTCNVVPIGKMNGTGGSSFAASFAADRATELGITRKQG